MIIKIDLTSTTERLNLSDGGAIVLLDRLGKDGRYSREDQARNVLRVDAQGHIVWQVASQFDAEGNPFTQLHEEEGKITAYRWDGGSYAIDVETGIARPLALER